MKRMRSLFFKQNVYMCLHDIAVCIDHARKKQLEKYHYLRIHTCPGDGVGNLGISGGGIQITNSFFALNLALANRRRCRRTRRRADNDVSGDLIPDAFLGDIGCAN